MRRDEIDWNEIRHDYYESPLKVEELCRRNGISVSQLYRRIRRDGWRRRVEGNSAWGTSAWSAEHGMPKALLVRLRNAISRRIRMIEKRSHGTALSETALESERQARAIGALIKALDQVMTLEKRLTQATAKPDNDNEGDDAAWRSRLVETLEQLFGSDAARGCAEPAAGSRQPGDRDELGGNGKAGSAAADRG